ncbi:MAG: response regulator transcription factor [Myxococcota bacterium]
MARRQVLIVDDEPAIRESLAYALEREGFALRAAPDLETARKEWCQADLVVLDLGLPDGSGLDLLRTVRSQSQLPIIILSSRDEETERVVALELGADDYVTKPFSPRELVARVRTVLRRSGLGPSSPPSEVLADPRGLSVHPAARRVSFEAQPIDLSRIEFDLLLTLMEAPDRVFTREQLIERVWHDHLDVLDRTVDVHVMGLRKKLHAASGDHSFVETVRGVGYRFSVPSR